MNRRRVSALSRKEFIQIARDPRSLTLALVIPVLLVFLFGYALTLDVDNVPVAIWNQDNSQVSKDFILNFNNSRYFNVTGYYDNYREMEFLMDKERIMMMMVIPKDFSKYIEADQKAPVQIIVDGSDSNTATIVMGYIDSIVARYNLSHAAKAIPQISIEDPTPIDPRIRPWFNPNFESKNYIIPGLIAVIIMIIAALLTSQTFAREWERGTMEQLISTPVSKGDLIMGKFIPYFCVGFFDLLVAMAVGKYIFSVPIKGSFLLLCVLSVLFLAGALLMGMFISITAKSQLVASQFAIIATFMPTYLLSGFMYPIWNMPKFIQLITYFIPARYYIVILRGIYLKSVGMAYLWPQALFLIAFALIFIKLSNVKFKKKVF